MADVDTEHQEIVVRRNLSAPQKGLSLDDRLDTPKSDEERTVDIGAELADALVHYLVRRREWNLGQGFSEDRSPWLFAREAGTPLDESRVRVAFKAVVRRAGLPKRFTPHSLRHTYASRMLTKGAPLAWVSGQLGHADVETT